MNIPCFLGGMSRGLLGAASPLQMRHCRKDALKEADVVILAGNKLILLFFTSMKIHNNYSSMIT